jgi:hypothetical protein
MATGSVKNWASFQHYKDRSPPWIKLHRELLDNFEYTSLPLASKALAPLIWLLAAESSDGSVNLDPAWLAWRLRIDLVDVEAGLTPLIDRGFLVLASKPIAQRLQPAIPEGEGETEGEREAPASKREKKVRLTDWIAALGGGDTVPSDDPLFDWAQTAGIPRDWIALAWWAFEARYESDTKTYADWRAVFRRAVREDWLRLWRKARAGGWELTTAGEGVRCEMENASV